MGDRGISVFGDMKREAVIGNDAGLLEGRHAFLDIEVDPDVRGNCKKVVLRNDLFMDGVEG